MFKTRYTEAGTQLFDRRSGWNILIDELCHETLSTAPASVSIALTGRCNLNCSYCFAEKNNLSLNYDALCGWLIELDENGCLGVGFGGGEPLLYDRLQDLCLFVRNSTCMACTMTTNARLIDSSIVKWMQQSVDMCRISVDGSNTVYESARGAPYKGLLERIELCVRAGIRVGINYLVNKDTLPCLDGVVDTMAGLGVGEILFLPEVPTGERRGVDAETLEYFKQWVKLYSGNVRLRLSDRFSYVCDDAIAPPGDTGLRAYAHISSSGVLKRTSFESEGVKIGESGLIAAFKSLSKGAI